MRYEERDGGVREWCELLCSDHLVVACHLPAQHARSTVCCLCAAVATASTAGTVSISISSSSSLSVVQQQCGVAGLHEPHAIPGQAQTATRMNRTRVSRTVAPSLRYCSSYRNLLQ